MKKTMKSLSSILLATMFVLTACTGGTVGVNSDNASKAEVDVNSDNASKAEVDVNSDNASKMEADVKGETHELVDFTILVPEGWIAMDFFEQTEVKLFKAKEEYEAYSGVPEVDCKYMANSEYVLATGVFDKYEEKDPVEIGDHKWDLVEGNTSSGQELSVLHTKVGEGFISVVVWTKVSDDVDAISLDDPDVQAILKSITIK